MEKKLEVKDLQISFRTNNGTVKAVRNISFDLYKGETLAVVGESGSGKSVTARAIMGILAPNAIVENGQIVYDGRDLLKISEEEYHTLRGDKLAMIFQDPLSSLNPIVRIGKQLTEAMILNNKERRRNARRELNAVLARLEKSMVSAGCDKQKTAEKIKLFRDFTENGIHIEEKYDLAHDYALEVISDIEDIELTLQQTSPEEVSSSVKELLTGAGEVYDEFVINDTLRPRYSELLTALTYQGKNFVLEPDRERIGATLAEMKSILKSAAEKEAPNFFCIGYSSKYAGEKPDAADIAATNRKARETLDKGFMLDFLTDVEKGIRLSYESAIARRKKSEKLLRDSRNVYEKENLDEGECRRTARELDKAVNAAINRLTIKKNSSAYVFGTTLSSAIDRYFKGLKVNPREEERFARDQAKYDRAIAAHREGIKPVPTVLIDTDAARDNMLRAIDEVLRSYEAIDEQEKSIDYSALSVEMIDYLKLQASFSANQLTKTGAKHRALELMAEVGIPEPRKRYNQYPFQFSGGMRQRIVIAIALSANPDILICDEPTTALDVTIQAQILELINNLKEKRGLSIIFITHDLGVVANMADRIAVMYAGKVVEYGLADDIFYAPAHPYTWALLSSMPDLDTREKLAAIPGTPPNMIMPPKGDAFAARNQYALQIDFEEQPPMFKISDTHYAATWLLHPSAPKVTPPAIVTDRIARMKKLEEQSHE